MLLMENPAVNISASAILADPSKWRALLDQFEEVLKTNIFIIDVHGRVLVPMNFIENQKARSLEGAGSFLDSGRFGAALIEKSFGMRGEGDGFLPLFEPCEPHLQASDPFDLRLYAVPVKKDEGVVLFYLIIGPLRLADPWPDERYVALAKSLGLTPDEILKNINAVPQMSQSALGAVLDLLSEVVRDVYELSVEKQRFAQLQFQGDSVRPEIIDTVQSLLANIQHDELLIAILDAAIKMSGAEGGSIMTLDEEGKDFVIKVSRGLENKKNIVQSRFRVGEGIAGIAAQEKIPFFISGTEGDVRIRHLLKRPDIRQSFVVPIVAELDPSRRVIGVLNLSIKNPDSPISVPAVQQDIQKFSPLIAAALLSL